MKPIERSNFKIVVALNDKTPQDFSFGFGGCGATSLVLIETKTRLRESGKKLWVLAAG
jgi:hypothetical protein